MSKVKTLILTNTIILFSIFINNVNVLAEEIEAFTYYNQGWYKDVAYCDSGKTVSSSGCGATSLSVVASSLSNSKYTPKYVANYICKYKREHVGRGTKWAAFTDKDVLKKFDLQVEVLFKKTGKIRGNAGKTYSSEEGNKIFNAIKQGKGVVLHIPGHYVAIGPHPSCSSNEVYYYQVSNSKDKGCYTPKELFNKSYNYKKRCTENGNCGWKAAFAYNSTPKIKVYFNANGAKLGNNNYKLNSTNNNILKANTGNRYYKTYKYTATKIDLLNYNGTTFKMSYEGMKNASPVWNTKADGSGRKFYQTAGKHDAKELFEASGCSEDKDCSITLYAQWKPIEYNIHYVGNGATGQVYDEGHCDSNGKCGLEVYTTGTQYEEKTQTFKHATDYKYNSNITLRKNRFYKEGYTFSGWAESTTGTVKYQDKDVVKNLTTTNGDTIYLYAKWTKVETPEDNIPGDNNLENIIPEDVLESEEREPEFEELEEDTLDNNSSNEVEEENIEELPENINDEEYVDEDYGDDISDTEETKEQIKDENITTNPKTGQNKFIIVGLICIISIFFLIYYRKVYYQ